MNNDINQTIDFYLNELEHYTFEQLCAKPSIDDWSLGQMYLHLIEETNFYINQINTCIINNDYQNLEASDKAKKMFLNNELPNLLIKGSPDNLLIPQPESKQQLIDLLLKLKDDLNHNKISISQSQFKGKALHPGLQYLSANEWLQFADMHFSHHLRQKKRIDRFLKSLQADY